MLLNTRRSTGRAKSAATLRALARIISLTPGTPFADLSHMLKRTILAGVVVFSLFAVRTASAAVCVEIDTTKDTLSEPDRNATRILLAQALQQQGQQVADANCMGVFRVYHVKLGNSITVFMQAPQGYREGSVRAIEEIPAIYSQMIRSLMTGQPMNTHGGSVDRTNATSAQQAPRRVEADSLWYARLGYAGVMNPIMKGGPAIGFGYRYELDSIGIDFSFFNFMFASDSDDSGATTSLGVTGSWIKLMGLYFLNPTSNASTYLGAGVSWGAVGVAEVTDPATGATRSFVGSGLQGEVSAGFEFLRASTIRMFIQADATMPFYAVREQNNLVGTSSSSWAPTIGISLGLGWGRSITRVHVIQ
jgi:hypothetical protein